MSQRMSNSRASGHRWLTVRNPRWWCDRSSKNRDSDVRTSSPGIHRDAGANPDPDLRRDQGR
jgi:hypothetical protein